MNIETKKYNIINWITRVNNENLIDYLESLSGNENDNWSDLPAEVKNGIKISIEQADMGNLKSNDIIFRKYLPSFQMSII